MRFYKYHGLGNDFILLAPEDPAFRPDASLARALCARGFGVGGDGVMCLIPASGADFDVEMALVNSDGSTPEMCGNGIRCAVRHAVEHLGLRANPLAVLTPAGVRSCAWRAGEGGDFEVTVSMGRPRLDAAAIPLAPPPRFSPGVAFTLEAGARAFAGVAVNIGNPHFVTFGDASEATATTFGPRLEHHPAFPERANIGFCEVVGPQHLRDTVWERGCGLTWACGTGATAAAIAAAILGHVDPSLPVTVTLRGGDLRIRLIGPAADLIDAEMTGPATRVFEGRLD
jgi:diaminopimelate epimerase